MVSSIRAGGICVRVGGNCLKYLKRGWNRTEGRRQKDFKKGGRLGQGVGALKMVGGGGARTPLQTMIYWTKFHSCISVNKISCISAFPSALHVFYKCIQNTCPEQIFESPEVKAPILKRDSNMFYWEVSKNILSGYFFKMLMDECFQKSNILLSRTMDASEWMSRKL